MIPAEERASGLKEQLRREATRLFATRGFAGTSMRELVEACNCTKAACYYYYKSKEALYRDVVLHHSGRMRELISRTLEGDAPVRERLHSGVDGMVDYSIDSPLAMRLFQRRELATEENAPVVEGAACREDHLKLIVGMLEEAVSRGEIRRGVQPEEAALVLMGAMHFQFEVSVASGNWNRERIHKTIDLVFDGIANND